MKYINTFILLLICNIILSQNIQNNNISEVYKYKNYNGFNYNYALEDENLFLTKYFKINNKFEISEKIYKEINFNVDLDCRAYSFNNVGKARVYKNLTTITVPETKPYYPYAVVNVEKPTGEYYDVYGDVTGPYDAPELIKHDSINLDYNTFKYQKKIK